MRENGRLMSRTRRSSTRATGETDVAPHARAGRQRGRERATPASASSTTCSTCSPATGAWTSTCAVDRRPGDRRAPHGRGHRHRARPGARPGARRPRAASPATATPIVPMDEARATCAIDISGRPFLRVRRRRCRPGHIAGFDHELAEEFFRAVATDAKLTLHVEVEAGTNAHHMIEAAFKAFARALRDGRRDRPDRDRRAVDEGDAHVSGARASRSSTTGWATAAPSRRRSSTSARERTITADHDEIRAADGVVVPGVGAFPEAMAQPARARARRADPRARPRRACRCSASASACSCCSTARSEHGGAAGLGLLPGEVRRLDAGRA